MNQAIEHIVKNAELVAEKLELHFDEESIKFLEGFIERQRVREDLKSFDGLVNTLGSYLGECIIKNHGGSWDQDDQGFCVKFDENNKAYPFSKVRKQFENGLDDSVFAFYTSIPSLFIAKN